MFFLPALAAGIVSGIFSLMISTYVLGIGEPSSTASLEEILDWFARFVSAFLMVMFTVGVLSWITGTISSGMNIRCTSDLVEKGSTSLRDAFDFAVGKLLSLLAVTIIVGILVMLGLIALFVPGVILTIMYSLAVPTILNENVGAVNSLSRSKQLVSHRWMKTLVLLLLVGVLVLFVSFIGTLFGAPFGATLSWLPSSIFAALVQPILPISLAVYYFSMRAKEEEARIPTLPPPPF